MASLCWHQQALAAVQTMYFVDTYKSCIWEFRTDDQGVPVKNGSGAYEKREVVKVPQEEGIPDGMTIDRQAKLWHLATDTSHCALVGASHEHDCCAHMDWPEPPIRNGSGAYEKREAVKVLQEG